MKSIFIYLTAIALLILCLASSLADNFVSELRAKFNSYREKYPATKLYINFNQPKYSPGDTIKLSSVYVDAATNSAVKGKQIVNFSLFNNEGILVIDEKISVKDGHGNNSFLLPMSITPGSYKFIAYTNWMKNFDQKFFFQKELIITAQSILTPVVSNVLDAQFFPEGGKLVEGVKNKLVIKIPKHYQLSDAVLKDERGNATVLVFDKNGFAESNVLPTHDSHFVLGMKLSGKEYSLPIPRAEPGVALEFLPNNTNASNVEVKLSRSPGYLTQDHNLFLVVNNYKEITFTSSLQFSGDESIKISIPTKNQSRESLITIIDEKGKIYASTVFYFPEAQSFDIRITKSKNDFLTRENGEIKIAIKDLNGNPVSGNFAVRIVNQDLFSNIQQTFADFVIADTSRHTLAQKNNLATNLESALIKNDGPSFQPEKYLRLSGKAVLAENKPVPDSTLLMFFFEHETFGYETYALKNGEFSFPLVYDFSGVDKIFYAGRRKGKDLKGLSIILNEQQPLKSERSLNYEESAQDDPYGFYQYKKRLIDNSFTFFSKEKENDTATDPNFLIEDELGGADYIINLKDYVVFPTMADVIKEVLRAADHRKVGGRNIIRVYTTNKRPSNDAEPLYVIDGVLTKDTEVFLSLNPEDVVSIKVIRDGNKLMRLGSLFSNGVILVRTKNSKIKESINQENIFSLRGILKSDNFYNLDQRQQREPNIPDLRPCLYWNPQVALQADGSASIAFNTSDDVGNFIIEITGLSNEGIPFYASEKFKVQFSSTGH